MHLSIADTYLHALALLSPGDVKRTAAFLDKLVHSADAAGMRPEIVHDAGDHAIRSFKVTHDLRSIARVDGDRLLLLWVARHDRAYEWARDHCLSCDPEVGVIEVQTSATATPGS